LPRLTVAALFLFGVVPLPAQVQNAWVARFHQSSQSRDIPSDLKVDNLGNVCVTGVSSGTNNYDFATVKYSPAGQQLWVKYYDGPDGLYDAAARLALDALGNVYVTGQSTTTNGTRFATLKYSPGGVQLWAVGVEGNFATNANAWPSCLIVDGTNVIVTGVSTGTGLSGYAEFLTVKYNTGGRQLWSASYRVSDNSYDTPIGLAVDAGGNIYVLGRSSSQNALTESVLLKYAANGQQLWVVRYDGPGNTGAYPAAIAVDGSGHIYACGNAYLAPGYGDYLVKYDSDGRPIWVATYTAPGASSGISASPTALAVDGSGSIYLAGSIGGYQGDYGTAKFDSAGGLLWAARYSGPGLGYDVPNAMALDANGNAYVTGRSWGTNTQDDFATVKYDANGNQLWVSRYASTNTISAVDEAFALAVDAAGNVYVTGSGNATGLPEFVTVKYEQTVVAGLPVISVPPQGRLAEAGTTVTFTVTATGSGSLSFQWRQNGLPIAGATNNSLQVIAGSGGIETDYSVEVRNALGAIVSPEARLSAVFYPTIVSSPLSRSAAAGVDVTFTVEATAFPSPSYQWFFNGAALLGATNAELVLRGVTPSNAGGYFVVVSNYLGAAMSAVAMLRVAAPGPLDSWTWRNPLPQGNSLKATAFGNGLFVAVANAGTIVTSVDGVNWVVQRSGVGSDLNAIAFGNGRFIAAGASGTVLTSDDGTNWVAQPFDIGTNPNAIAFGNGRFVLVSYSYVFVSTDGVHWFNSVVFPVAALNSLVYGNGLFVGVGGNNAVFTSSDGVSWANHSLAPPQTAQLLSVTYGNNRFVAVGFNAAATSTDGTDWTLAEPGPPAIFSGVGFGNGQFVSVGGQGGAKSVDGLTWTPIPSSNALSGIAFGNGLFAAVGPLGAIVTSTDTVTWSNHRQGTTENVHAIASDHGVQVAVGTGGMILTSSNGGLAWARVASGTTLDLYGITFANSNFFAVGNNGVLLTSTNGSDWAIHASSTISRLHDVIWAGGQYVAVGRDGVTISSLDGLAWAAHYVGTNSYLRGIAYGNGRYVAAGAGSQFFVSTNATNWTKVDSGIIWDLNDVTFGNGLFVAVSDTGLVLTSANGMAWTTNNLQIDLNLRTVLFANGLFIAAGNNGTLLSSPDGITWTLRHTGFAENFRGICYAGSRFTSVGNNGGILQSASFAPAQLAVRTRPTSAGLELTILGEIGRPYRLQASTDLVTWIDLFSFSNSTDATLYLDPRALAFQKRFYRAVSP